MGRDSDSAMGLSGGEKVRIVLLYGIIVAVTVFGFLMSFAIGRIAIVLAGLGLVSYMFGLRHAFDADHIAAIDNVVRKLMQDDKRPLSAGLFSRLGTPPSSL